MGDLLWDPHCIDSVHSPCPSLCLSVSASESFFLHRFHICTFCASKHSVRICCCCWRLLLALHLLLLLLMLVLNIWKPCRCSCHSFRLLLLLQQRSRKGVGQQKLILLSCRGVMLQCPSCRSNQKITKQQKQRQNTEINRKKTKSKAQKTEKIRHEICSTVRWHSAIKMCISSDLY